jgi:two-component system response regulator FlrC
MGEIRTVLIVEDEDSIADALAELFDVPATRAVTARSLEEATRALRDHAFDLIVTDVRLGAVRDGGLRVLAQAGFLAPDAAAIALTAYPSDGVRGASMRLGATTFLEKPVDLATIAGIAARRGIASAMFPAAAPVA